MKRFYFMLAFASTLSCVSCTDSYDSFFSHENTEDLLIFEKKIASSYYSSTRSNPGELDYQLIGFTTITFSADEQEVVKKVSTEYSDSIDNMGNVYVAKDGSFVRIYYPLRNAIVKIKGKTIVADEDGRLTLPQDVNLKKTRVIGREKTERSTYTTFNVKIFPTSQYIDNNVLVFDLGERYRDCCNSDEPKHSKSASENENGQRVSCTVNHLPYYNCSYAYPSCVNTSSNCTTQTDRCMDYNGWYSDCSGSHHFFLGSDCFNAMAIGYCWNEIM